MTDDTKFTIEKFNGTNFAYWKMQIEDLLYQKNFYLPLGGKANKPATMSDLEWEVLDRKALEEQTNPLKTPTKDNLLRALRWLGQGCQPGDSLVFHYSGHGLRLRNYRLSEVDGYNETLCPMDLETRGMIFDDEINEVIVGHLPRGVKLHAIIDSCHRNSVLDLRSLCRKNRSGQYEWENPSGVFKGTSGGDAISFSGSVEVPTSAYTPAPKNVKPTMTSRFIKAIEDGQKQKQKLTYKSILDSMQSQNTIKETDGNLRQEPLLSACGPFDVNSPFTL